MSFPRYPAYKESGVEWLGAVPSSWRRARFKGVFREREERSIAGEETLLSVSAYTGVTPRSEILDDGDHLSRAESLEGYKVCYPNDLVMNIMLAWNRGLGMSPLHGICSPAYSVFQVFDGSSPRYLHYLLRSDEYIRYFKAFSAGVIDSRLRLYPDAFGALITYLPSADEQEQIAGFLDHETAKIDALIAEQEQLITLLKEKRQAVISHALTKGLDPSVPMKDSGVEWLGEVPAHWEVKALKFVATVQTGVAKGKDNTGKDTVVVPYLRVANVQDGYLDLADMAEIEIPATDLPRYLLHSGDVLMNEGGDFDKLGRGHVWRAEIYPCIHQNHVFAVRPHSVSPEWLNMVTSSSYAQFYFMSRSKQSTNLASISSTSIMDLPVVLPPVSEQMQLLSFLDRSMSSLRCLVDEAVLSIELLHERRSALISAAVTGQIDVRGWAEKEAA